MENNGENSIETIHHVSLQYGYSAWSKYLICGNILSHREDKIRAHGTLKLVVHRCGHCCTQVDLPSHLTIPLPPPNLTAVFVSSLQEMNIIT